MNPSYMASMKALSTLYLSAFLGIEPKPVVKEDKETSINGRAFAPGKGIQQEVSSEEKEAKVRAHLDKLAKEAKARYLYDVAKYPEISELHKTHTTYIERRIAANREEAAEKAIPIGFDHDGLKHEPKHTHMSTEKFDKMVNTLKKEINYPRRITSLEIVKPKYPTSDLIDELNDHIEEQERIANSVIHTGEAMNLEEDGTKFEAQ